VKPKFISVAVASCFVAGAAFANPNGPSVVKGNATIVQNGNLLQITNTPNAILNWQSFSIGANEITRFVQQSASSAVLNRVVTQNPSTILGALQSNGRVFIVNPNGILFGAGAQVDVAGLVASTLSLSDADFLAGRMRFGQGLGSSVVNQGNITTGAGGNVYLVGSAVTNNGIITSPQGEVILAAGNSVELVNPGTPNLRVEIAAADHEARNLGQIISDAGRIGIYAGLINNSGTIRADSAIAEGGSILLKATKNARLESSSVLSAKGQGGGEIKVLADGSVQVAGRLDASAPSGGDGGFIETSAKKVHVDAGTVVTTTALKGKTGTWLIDPDDFVIVAQGGDITGAELGRNLSTTSVIINSDSVGPTPVPDPNGFGDILVNDSIAWTAPNSLTLAARRNVTINGLIAGGGDLNFYAGWDGNNPSGPFVVTSGAGDITSSFNNIQTAGDVFFRAGRDILLGASTVSAGLNATDALAKTAQLVAGRDISLTDPSGGALVIATGNNNTGSSATVILLATTGTITMQGSELLAIGGGTASVNGGAAGVTLNAGNGITLNNSTVSAIGADGISGGSGTTTLVAGSGITLSSSAVSARGGGGVIGAGGNATVTLSTGGDIALASAGITSSGAGSRPGTAQIFLTFLTSTGNFSVNGVPGAIVDTSLGGEGFFVDGLPAILDVNFFVTKPSDAPVFNDVLVATMNQQVDVLGDQLKTGGIDVIDQNGQKKLSVCN
jgi:filamentous hemagglutinin family protein